MNIVRALRFAIIKFVRFWNPLLRQWRSFKAAFIGSILYILEPLKKLKKTEGEQPNDKSEKPPNPPLIVPAKHGPENQHNAKETWKDLTKWGKFKRVFRICEGFGIAAGIIALIVVYRQLETMQVQTQAMQGQWQVMTNQATIMQGQLDEMQRTRMQDERAWVGIVDVEPEFISGILSYFRADYKNTGKTPAVRVQTRIIGTAYPNTILTRDQQPYPSADNIGMLAPGGTSLVDTMAEPLPNQVGLDIIGGKYPFYVYGTVWYTDIFGTNHWTQFCVKIIGYGKSIGEGGANETQWTPFHNTCDDAQTNAPPY